MMMMMIHDAHTLQSAHVRLGVCERPDQAKEESPPPFFFYPSPFIKCGASGLRRAGSGPVERGRKNQKKKGMAPPSTGGFGASRFQRVVMIKEGSYF